MRCVRVRCVCVCVCSIFARYLHVLHPGFLEVIDALGVVLNVAAHALEVLLGLGQVLEQPVAPLYCVRVRSCVSVRLVLDEGENWWQGAYSAAAGPRQQTP